jgi:hypothetical protein
MAEEKKTETKEAQKAAPIELGEFEVRAINDGGAEARLTDSKSQTNIISRLKKANTELEQGATYRIYAEKVSDAPQPERTVVEVATADLKSMPESTRSVNV